MSERVDCSGECEGCRFYFHGFVVDVRQKEPREGAWCILGVRHPRDTRCHIRIPLGEVVVVE